MTSLLSTRIIISKFSKHPPPLRIDTLALGLSIFRFRRCRHVIGFCIRDTRMFEGLRIPGQAYPGSFSYVIPAASVKSVLERNSSLYKPWSPFLSGNTNPARGSTGQHGIRTHDYAWGHPHSRRTNPSTLWITDAYGENSRISAISGSAPRLCLIELEDIPDLDETPEPISEKKIRQNLGDIWSRGPYQSLSQVAVWDYHVLSCPSSLVLFFQAHVLAHICDHPRPIERC